MGVTGLWKLIEPCGQPVPVEMLESKILAIDISIWLHQVVKGFQDSKGSALANSHLLGLFHRLCKLMYYRIKPVFVFDGKVPSLKKETIAKRNLKRNKLMNEADRIQTLLLQSLAKEKVVQQALGSKAAAELLKASPSKTRSVQKRPDIDDMFKLPDLPEVKDVSEESDLNTTDDTTCSSEIDSSFEDSKPRNHYNQNLQAIDVKSKHFRNLPADIRHEILIDIKETRKQSSWGKLHELPTKSNDFSVYQMKRLLKRRQVQECLEEAEKEMDGVRTFTMSELENIFSEEGIIEPSSLPNTKHISSDSNTRFLLVRDLKRTLATVAESEEVEPKPETSTSAIAKTEILNKDNQSDLGDEYDDDLQKAIQMSLDASAVYSESDYEFNGKLKLSKEQRNHLKNAAVGLARAYMIEHAGMNDDDVQGLLEHTQAISDDDEFNYAFGVNGEKNLVESLDAEKEALHKTPPHPVLLPTPEIKQQENSELNLPKNVSVLEKEEETSNEVGVISDSNSDSDFEEVCHSRSTTNPIPIDDRIKSQSNLEIFVDTSKSVNKDEDIFADVFSPSKENKIEIKPSPSAITKILEDLKKQASEVKKISLTDIKLDPSIIEISDDESARLSQNLVYETDSDALTQSQDSAIKDTSETQPTAVVISDEELVQVHSLGDRDSLEDLQIEASESTKSDLREVSINSEMKPQSSEIIEIVDDSVATEISPTYRTPSKTKSISQFFETKYVIKRTPEKPSETIEDVPKVKSPFFIKKTPRSSSEKNERKRNATDDEASPLKKSNKAAKMLFEKSDDDDIEMKFIKEDAEPISNVQIAANVLRENKTREELEDLASDLAKEKVDLEKERNRQDRMGMTITERMNSECMQLLRLFGVPFIVAPMEAEAQCAFLDAMQLTNGTITDDSDIWLFGGQTVYKNFFAQNKHVMEFKSDRIESSFNVNRQKLIQLALLVGSDYTTGVHGIGAVTALEILSSFSVNEPKEAIANQQTATVLATLRSFRDWWSSAKSSIVIGNSTRHRLRNKLKNIELHDGFPSPAVVEAYLTPTVDDSKETFCWGSPDVESIREFTRKSFGWTRLKTDEILGPVLKKLNEKKSQSTIKNYFAVKSTFSTKQLPVSKRVQTAINKMSEEYKSDEEKDKAKTTAKRGRRKKNPASTSISDASEDIPKKSARISKKNVMIPTSLEVIPQKQKDIEDMEQKKNLAAAVLKKSKK